MGCHFILQGIFLTQGSNWHLLLGRWILYHWATRETHLFLFRAPYMLLLPVVLFWGIFSLSTLLRLLPVAVAHPVTSCADGFVTIISPSSRPTHPLAHLCLRKRSTWVAKEIGNKIFPSVREWFLGNAALFCVCVCVCVCVWVWVCMCVWVHAHTGMHAHFYRTADYWPQREPKKSVSPLLVEALFWLMMKIVSL